MDEDSIERIRSASFPIARKGYDKREVERFLTGLADWLEGGGSDQALSDVIKRELERVGEKTGAILAAAHEAAEEIRVEAEEDAGRTIEEARREEMRIRSLIEERQAETRGEADQYAEEKRQEADLYLSRTREEADRYSEQATADADRYSTGTRAEADEYAGQIRAEAEREVEGKRSEVKHEAQETILAAEAKAKQAAEAGDRRRRDMETLIADLSSRRDAVLEEIRRLSGELSSAVGSHSSEPGSESPADADAEEAPASPPGESRAGKQASG